MSAIPYGRQDINQADIDAVVAVLRSDFLTQGPAVPAFEKAVADYCGAQHAVAVNSAASAPHIACLALGVGKGDSVWTTPITFVARILRKGTDLIILAPAKCPMLGRMKKWIHDLSAQIPGAPCRAVVPTRVRSTTPLADCFLSAEPV